MKISYEWIRTYVPTKLKADSLVHQLTMCGHETTSIEEKDNDFIFDIEVTPNRFDCLSHIGIAREVAAITKKTLKIPSVNLAPCLRKGVPIPKVTIKNDKLCRQYTGRVITDVKVAPSPNWLLKRIKAIGLRPVNNIVDITNYVLFETGQPLHAFDYDKIAGNSIIIRSAQESETIKTIDGENKKLKRDMLVIADNEKPIAVAGVMGALNTEVSSSTKSIFLESAWFDPISIRHTARDLGLSSDSSYRFERGIDPAGVVYASDRAAALICTIAKGKASKKFVNVGKKITQEDPIIELRPSRVNLLLGTKMSNSDIKKYLTSIGFKVSGTKSMMHVVVPSFRRTDVKREADLIEEIARIYGYDNIPVVLSNAVITEEEPVYKRKSLIAHLVRSTLTGLGLNEMLTYSLLSQDDINKVDAPTTNVIPVRNPLSDQQGVMRNTLLPGALKAIKYNINMGNRDVKLFEFSNIYFRQNSSLEENKNLLLALSGNSTGNWKRKPEAMDLFYLKGILSTLLNALGINATFEETQHPSFEPGNAMTILVQHKMLGVMGLVKKSVLENMDIKTDAYIAEINEQGLLENANLKKHYKPIIKYPVSERDVSMCINTDISFENIYTTIKNTARGIIKHVELIEEYKGKQIPKGQRSLLVRITYQAKDKTLKEDEIDSTHSSIRANLSKEYQVSFR